MNVDAAGTPINVGDVVYMAGDGSKGKTSQLVKRVIVGFTPKMVKVDYIDPEKRDSRWDSTSLRYPHAVVKVPESTPTNIEYEYGVHCVYDDDMQDPHRTGMENAQEVHQWIQEFVDFCPPGNRIKEVYIPIRKPIGKWEKV